MATILTPEQLAAVAEYGPLYAAKQVWAPKQKRMDELAPVICAIFPNLAAGEAALAEGAEYDIQIGERAIVKDWTSKAAVSKAVGGAKVFLKLATATYKAVSGVIGNTAADALQTAAQTGNRRLKAVARVAPAVVELPVELPKAA